MKYFKTLSTIIISSLLASSAWAAPTSCPNHYAGGNAPDLVNAKLSAKTREVCYTGYGLLHSGVTRTPLYPTGKEPDIHGSDAGQEAGDYYWTAQDPSHGG